VGVEENRGEGVNQWLLLPILHTDIKSGYRAIIEEMM
jgi:hypothetical protein